MCLSAINHLQGWETSQTEFPKDQNLVQNLTMKLFNTVLHVGQGLRTPGKHSTCQKTMAASQRCLPLKLLFCTMNFGGMKAMTCL